MGAAELKALVTACIEGDKMEKKFILHRLKLLSKNIVFKSTLYLNIDRVKDLYEQNGGLSTIDITDELSSGVSGGLKAVIASFSSNLTIKEGIHTQVQISPLLMILILEQYKQQEKLLLDPSLDPKQNGALYKYVTDEHVHVVRVSESVDSHSTDLSEKTARTVQEVREEQVREYEDMGIPRKTIVWVAAGETNLASIGSLEYVNPNNLASYPKKSHEMRIRTGILGLWEQERKDTKFLTPLWIWHE